MENYVLVQSDFGIISTLIIIIGVSFMLQRLRAFKYVGPLVTIIIIGLIAGHAHILPHMTASYGFFLSYAIPPSLILLCIATDLSDIKKLNSKMVLSLASNFVSLIIICTIAGVIFTPVLPESWKLAGMFIATYTGGSVNLNAIAHTLNTSKETVIAANTADYLIGLPIAMTYFVLPRVVFATTWFKNLWPYTHSDYETHEINNDEVKEFLGEKIWSIHHIATLLAIVAAIYWFSEAISALLPADYAKTAELIIYVTLAFAIGQIPYIKKIKAGAVDLGIFFGVSFVLVLVLMLDFSSFLTAFSWVVPFCALVLVGGGFIHFAICKLLKVPYEYTLIALMAGTADGSTAGILASTAGWQKLVPVGILIGIVSALLGNYAALIGAYLVNFIVN